MTIWDLATRLAKAIGGATASTTRSGPVPISSFAPAPSRPSPASGRSAGPLPGPPGRAVVSPTAPAFTLDVRSTGLPAIEYAPDPDGDADPGEVVWAWVPYEEDASQGKDRPVLVIGRSGGRLVALILSSKDHDFDAADEARHGRFWMDVGAGGWDPQRRPSEVRLDRVLSLPVTGVRREGAALAKPVFAEVATRLRAQHAR